MATNYSGMELEGIDEMMRHVKELGYGIDAQVEDEMVKEAAEHFRDAVENSPLTPVSPYQKKHGKDHFLVVKIGDGDYEVGIDEKFFYMYMHEIGADGGVYKVKDRSSPLDGEYVVTPDVQKRPFFRPTFENEIDEMQRKMGRVLKRRLGLE